MASFSSFIILLALILWFYPPSFPSILKAYRDFDIASLGLFLGSEQALLLLLRYVNTFAIRTLAITLSITLTVLSILSRTDSLPTSAQNFSYLNEILVFAANTLALVYACHISCAQSASSRSVTDVLLLTILMLATAMPGMPMLFSLAFNRTIPNVSDDIKARQVPALWLAFVLSRILVGSLQSVWINIDHEWELSSAIMWPGPSSPWVTVEGEGGGEVDEKVGLKETEESKVKSTLPVFEANLNAGVALVMPLLIAVYGFLQAVVA